MDDFVIPFANLPEGFARSIERPPPVPAMPRPAATIVLLRDGEDGMEVLLMRRNRNAGFVPGAYVFPGGRVDATDADPRVVAMLDGLDAAEAADRLDLPAPTAGADHDDAPPAIAFYLAALREAFEETGILVGKRSDGVAPATAAEDPMVDTVRDALMQDEIDFAGALEQLDSRIAGDSIEYVAHWITPEPEPRRYDTRFFAALVPPGSTAIVDPREMTDARWLTPSAALDRCDRGELPMVFPTIKTIEQLASFGSAAHALAALGAAPVRTIMPTLVITDTGVGLQIDDD